MSEPPAGRRERAKPPCPRCKIIRAFLVAVGVIVVVRLANPDGLRALSFLTPKFVAGAIVVVVVVLLAYRLFEHFRLR